MLGMAGLVQEISDLDRLKKLEARLKFHTVHVPEDGWAVCREFASVDQLTDYLRPLIGRHGQVFIFFGDRWNLTKGSLKFLVPPPGQGDRVPLFQDADQLEVDLEGGTALDPAEPEDALPPDPTEA